MFDRGQLRHVAGVRYLAVRREDGIGLERIGSDGSSAPLHEECGHVVVAGLDDHEVLAREGAEVHFATHPSRTRVIVWAVSDSPLASRLLGSARPRRIG